ncbi:MAG TPA: AAA family ATPase [Mycobacteriales bacterium]|nr:AAA family ATPase [Mycobacteriales bacterium]
MLTTARTLGVLDRTRQLQLLSATLDVEPVDLSLTTFALAGTPAVDVLVVGSRELSPTGLRRLERWTRLNPAGVVVAHVDGLAVDRAALRAAGVDHVIRGPLTKAKLTTAVRRADTTLEALCAAAGQLQAEQPVALLPQQRDDDVWDEDAADEFDDEAWAETADGTPARLVTIASATGGCGKTFYATNAAALLARAGQKVLVVDLDLQFGEVAAALQVKHPYSVYDGLFMANGERLPRAAFAEHFDELVFHHPLGFDVLTAPRDPVLADYIGARDAATVLDAVGDRYDVVIADTPPSLNDVVIAALDRSVSVTVLATLDVPSLRNLTAFLDVLRRLGMDDERIDLVLNKAENDVGVTVEQANEAFQGRFRSVLPVDRAVSRSVNLGTTVVTHEPHSKVARALVPSVTLLSERLGFVPQPADILPDPGSVGGTRLHMFFDRLLRRFALGGNA